MGSDFAKERAVHVGRAQGEQLHRTVGRLGELGEFDQWRWPCDYAVRCDGAPAIARWSAGAWLLER